MPELEARTMAKVTRQLVPFLMLCYFVAYLDRVNVSVAALTMNKALNISASAYGFGAGIFFFAYFVFEVPSNLALERFGARKWIARIMLSWGVVSGCMALITGETGFYIVRVLLGAAEAGFFGPFAMGSIKQATGSFAGGLFAIAACALVSFVVVLLLPHDRKLELAPVE